MLRPVRNTGLMSMILTRIFKCFSDMVVFELNHHLVKNYLHEMKIFLNWMFMSKLFKHEGYKRLETGFIVAMLVGQGCYGDFRGSE